MPQPTTPPAPLGAAPAQLPAHIAPMVGPQAPPTAPTAPPRIKWGGYMICSVCRMEESYCGCAKPPPPPPQGDGVDSSLNRRIRDCNGR